MRRVARCVSRRVVRCGALVVLATAVASSDSAAQDVAAAERLLRHGDRAGAVREAQRILNAYERDGERGTAATHLAAGRAYLVTSASDAGAVRRALRAFDMATAADSTNPEGELRASDLLLDKYNAPDALQGYENVLRRDPRNAWALLGVARVTAFAGSGDALARAQQALAADARFVPALVFVAERHLEAERPDSARVYAQRALAVEPEASEAVAVLAALAWVAGDSVAFRAATAQATRIAPRPVHFYVTLSEAAARVRRYAEAHQFAAQALALDSLSVPALGAVGTNLLRAGRMAEGRAQIERAFALDPFNLWHKNTLDLLDQLNTFRTVRLGRFEYVVPAREADILLPYLSPLLEEAYDALATQYDYRPPAPVRLEIYPRHADFSVRTVGLTGLGALGVSFGTVLAMDAPSARDPGSFNWGSTAWHELTHTFTLGLSGNRVPRWFSEGASVLAERQAREGWGTRATPAYVAALKAGFLRPVSSLDDGFLRPRSQYEVLLSYYHASLVVEWMTRQFGAAAVPAMLRGWRDGLTTAQVVQQVLTLDEPTLDRRFDDWVRARFARELAAARAAAPPDSVPVDDADLAAHRAEAHRAARAGNDTALVDALERMLWIWPYDPAVHVQLAEAAQRLGQTEKAVRERRAVVAIGASDPLAARTELARALLAAGDRAGARREVLAVLEQAPTYERAQQLLLEMRRTSIPERE